MQDDQLLSDLRALNHPIYLEHAEKFAQNGIRSYSQLLALLRDESADDTLRADACWVVSALRKKIDGRRIIPILLKLLTTASGDLRRSAMRTLGTFQSKHAVDPLLKLLVNSQASMDDRIEAIYALTMMRDEHIDPILQHIMFDEHEDVHLRSLAIEWSPRYEGMLNAWTDFLSDELPDIRFWTAYRLSQTWSDISPALAALDQVAAFDHAVPQTWGWHVDREALRPLENIYSRPYRLQEYGSEEDLADYGLWIVSPAAEYDTFARTYRRHSPDWFYETLLEPTIELKLDPDWLKEEIIRAWAGVTFDARQPKPQTYILDWYLTIDGQNLLGGLHRDHHALVLTGKDAAAFAFASWYRTLIDQKYPLYIYEWADTGIELTPGITGAQIAQSYEGLHNSRRALAVSAILST